ncbi:MAG: NADH-quinone oxidoreductase subunit M, partial [Dehalococcoidales bacterium]
SSSCFVAEVSVYLGAFSASAEAAKIITIISLVGILLAASYMLNMVMKVFFGPVRESFASLPDIGSVEKLYLGVLATGIFTVGLYPQLITTVLKPAIKGLAVLWGG